VPFNSSAGDPAANSYPSVAEADAYNATSLDAATWTAFVQAEKENRLILATMLIDRMPQCWTGAAATAAQALGWPRIGMKTRNGFDIDATVVPIDLKNAVSEFARIIKVDTTDSNDVVNQRITSVKAGSVSVTFDQLSMDESGRNVVPLQKSADLAGRLMVPDVVRVLLVPSWLLPTAEQILAGNKATLLFETFNPKTTPPFGFWGW